MNKIIKAINLVLFIGLVLVQNACSAGLKPQNICRDLQGNERECSKKEQSMIDGMQAIIKSIFNYRSTLFSGGDFRKGRCTAKH